MLFLNSWKQRGLCSFFTIKLQSDEVNKVRCPLYKMDRLSLLVQIISSTKNKAGSHITPENTW